jgi:hypothetical protein
MMSGKVIAPPELLVLLENMQKSVALHQERLHDLEVKLPSLDLATGNEILDGIKVEVKTTLQPQIRAVSEYLRQMQLAYSRPPFKAEYLLHLILPKEERAPVIGDLIEEYRYIQRRFGRRHANIWFYKQVITSVWPFVRFTLARIAAFVWLSRFF